jgi:hypothetical protein
MANRVPDWLAQRSRGSSKTDSASNSSDQSHRLF